MPEIDYYAWVILPLVIFVARAVDMTLSTLRIVFVAQGRGLLAAVIGFFEALIWLLVVGQALAYLNQPLCAVAYSAGFAAGNILGLKLEERLALGMRILRVIVPSSAPDAEELPAVRLTEELRTAGFGVTVVDGEGMKGPVKILFTLVERRRLPEVMTKVSETAPNAFLSVEDVRKATLGFFPVPRTNEG